MYWIWTIFVVSQVLICCVFAVISCASAGLLGGGGGGGDHHGHAGYSDSAYNHGGGYAAQPAPVEENVIQVIEEQVKFVHSLI